MSFATKLRKYIDISNKTDSAIAAEFGVTPAMLNKYLYCGSMPKYWRARKIYEVTDGFFAMEDMGY